MEQILVTTDLSTNSKAGMRFAIQMEQSRKAELTFLYIDHVLRASTWSDKEYDHYVKQSKEIIMNELSSFVKEVYRSMKVVPGKYKLVVHHSMDTVDGIIAYGTKCKADYICISTMGAGTFRRLYGTNAGKLIITSKIPVLCVPSNYRIRPVKRILYASDMTDYANELTKVVAFARPLAAAVEMLHLSYPYEYTADQDLMEQIVLQKIDYKISLHYRSRDIEHSLQRELSDAISKSKPSVLVMFTKQDRSFFERVFLSSSAKEYSFHATIPLLSFNKASVVKPAGRKASPGKKTKAKPKGDIADNLIL